MSLDMMGAEEIGQFDYGALLTTAGNVAEAGIKVHEAEEAAKKASAEEATAINAAISADATAASARATALTSAAIAQKAVGKQKAAADAKAAASQLVADSAAAAQDEASAALPAKLAPQRVAAARKALAAATAKLQSSPTDLYAQSLVKAWQQTLAKAQNAQITRGASDVGALAAPKEESFLSRKIVGPVRVWHAGAGVGVLGLGWVAVKKGLFRRLFGG